jgi:hypothetical protein
VVSLYVSPSRTVSEVLMRRIAIAALAILSACALRQVEGVQDLTFSVPSSADTLLARARQQLTELGYEITPTEEPLLLTAPRPVPDSLARTTDGGTDVTGHLWVLRVSASDQTFVAGSRAIVSAFHFPAPKPGDASPGNVVHHAAMPVTATSTPRLFSEVQRVAGLIQEAGSRRSLP